MTFSSPHSKDLRKGRLSIPGQVYEVTTNTHQRKPLFQNFFLGREVVKALAHQHQRGNVQSLALVVMPDHFHWLFSLGERLPLSEVLKVVKSWTGEAVNRDRNAPGKPVWQPGFHDRALRRDEDIRKVARYIIANPLRAELVDKIGDYPLWDAAWI